MALHKHWLYRYVRRYVHDRDDAYDVVQDAFVSAWTAIAGYDPSRPFTSWLRRIALNKCRDRARRRKFYGALIGACGLGGEPLQAAEENGPLPEQFFGAEAARQRLSRAIDRLPGSLKDALILTALEGLSQKEAGEVLQLNAKAVELRVYRAKKKLATMLERSDIPDIAGTAL